jgi:hypothetical protein
MRVLGKDVAFEWAFPLHMVDRVPLLKKAGLEHWWFDGPEAAARAAYAQRSGGPNWGAYEEQIGLIRAHWTQIGRELSATPEY